MIRKKVYLTDSNDAFRLFGKYDSNLKYLENKYDVNIFARGDEITIRGPEENVEQTERALAGMIQKVKNGEVINEAALSANNEFMVITDSGKPIKTRTVSQGKYVAAMNKYDMVFAIGPAGTGKTFLAVVQAINLLRSNRISRIVLTRPIVEAGEKLGFLPGDFYEKVNPYLAPLFDAFHYILGPHHFTRYKSEGIIDIVPLAYMRGRTLNDAFVILDEAQNTTVEQMKMFLTRLGTGSKAVITGDITQIDFEKKKESGLVLAADILSQVTQIKFVYFTEGDVLRHGIVKKIVKAFSYWEKKKDAALPKSARVNIAEDKRVC
ncbi:MAG: PhoH-like protein [Elusimicrobia bacterium ADurb.Bin231]|nr:MAG: PhoH-like protein [Elusimicrobia bacterium ADurb.Bin231]